MSFATEELRFLYDQVYAIAGQIGANAHAEPDDLRFREDVWELVLWRKGEVVYPFEDVYEVVEEPDDFLDVGLPLFTLGNGYQVIDARDYVPDLGTYKSRELSRIQRISIHHSVTREPITKDDELALMTEIGNYHLSGNGWPGYAYHWTVAPSGRPYYTGDMSTVRYVVGNDNPNNVAICLLGDFTNHPPTVEAQETAQRLIGEIGFSLGREIPWMAHRETPGTAPTSCCGNSYPDQWTVLVAV